MLTMQEGFKLLKKYGIPVAKFSVAADISSAAKAAKRIGYPVTVKLDSPDIVHKTDKGAVAVGLKDEKELRDALKKMLKRAGTAEISGIIVQESCSGKEIIIGGADDPQFGDIVMFGLGGIFVEVLKDVSLRVTPIGKRDAAKMVREIRGYPLLAGARGEKPANISSIVDAIVKASKMVEQEQQIKELDINPLFVNEKGAKAVDVRVITY